MAEWTFEHEGLTVRITRDAHRARIEWSGVSDIRSPASFLSPFLDDWSSKLKDTEVTVDLTALEYMNSATVKPLLDLVKLLDQTSRLVNVVFRDSDWQRAHRNCMAVLARTLKRTRVQ
ncbi:SiaC family regulatory phosphoprotein [Sorangium cellulosum]|uniref:SiaC family regulatory phosphoprotein n=1 Tax=Sorangium cellulosum TaxID=56 RepID=UPI003D9A663D